MSAVITGRTGIFNFSSIRIYNYPNGSILIQTGRLCDNAIFYTNLGTDIFLNKWTLSQVNGSYLYMIGLKRDVIYDTDGSLSMAFDNTTRSSATIVQGYSHISQFNQCPAPTAPTSWDNAVMCNSNFTLRRVIFTNLYELKLFHDQGIKVMPLTNITQIVDPSTSAALYTTAFTHPPYNAN